MWDEIENRLKSIEEAQTAFHGKCDSVRGAFVEWLIEEFLKHYNENS